MVFCRHCGTEIDDKAVICPHCGVQQKSLSEETDTGGFGWGALGFFVPVAGLVLYLMWKQEKPKSAKAAGLGALISTIIGVVFLFVYFLFVFFVLLIGIAAASV